MTPGHDGSISKNGSESAERGLDLLHLLQLMPHGTAVTTKGSITPGHNRSIAENGGESPACGLDMLHVFQLILHSSTVTTIVRIAQVTMDPQSSMAAHAKSVA